MNPHLADTPILTTERLVLRAPKPEDFPVWEAFYLSDRGSFIGGGPDEDAGRAWRAFAAVIGHWAMRGFGIFALTRRDTGAVIGGCGAWFPALWPEREIGWSIWDPAAEGRGLMAEAARAVLTHVYGELGWDTAVSYVDADNARSRALAERLGAAPDPDAATPRSEKDVLVYRHPRPEGGS